MSAAGHKKSAEERLPELIASIKSVQSEVGRMQKQWDAIPISTRSNDSYGIDTPKGSLAVGAFRELMNRERETLNSLHVELLGHIEQACVYYHEREKKAGATLATAEKAKEIAEQALRTASDTAAISAGEPFVAFFQKRAKELFWPVLGWGAASALFLASALDFLTHQKAPEPLEGASVALFISNRAIITAILVGTAIWCARQFRAAYERRENYRHRSVIIRTYQSFEASALSQDAKALMTQSIRHIFSPLPGDKDDSSTKGEIEMLKDILVPLVKKPSSE